MIPILDWIFEGIVGWVSSIASQLLDAVSGLFLEALGTDMTAMEEYFPFVTKAYGVIQVMAYAILILIVLWQLFRAFGGPITEAENPWHLVVRGALFGFLIGYAKPIFSVCLDIARAPYTSLMDISMTGEDFTFAGVEQALTNGLTTIAATASVVGLILILILLIALGWNYFKLLLETVERYIVVGVLCYTSPLAFSMGASKNTNNVFRSWCRMVGSQLLLLVMNVWFLRGFASSAGQFIGTGGVLTTGKGSLFLWMFCTLAYLKCAQRFDSYLASMGLNVAQTGSSMGMELLMAARVISGVGSSARSAGSIFGRAGGSATATGTGAAASGFAAGFASRFSPNSYVRDAVVEGGTRMGFSGGAGFVGRAFGGIAARNGVNLNGQSISSVASRAPGASGTIGGDIADRSLSNYMPHMSIFQLKGTQITGGHISTTATTPEGKKANVDMYSASQFEKPDTPHSVVTASDGSQWYQMASGEGRGAFYDAPVFGGMDTTKNQAGNVHNEAPVDASAQGGENVNAAAHETESAVPANIVPGADGISQGVGTVSSEQLPVESGHDVHIENPIIAPAASEMPEVGAEQPADIEGGLVDNIIPATSIADSEGVHQAFDGITADQLSVETGNEGFTENPVITTDASEMPAIGEEQSAGIEGGFAGNVVPETNIADSEGMHQAFDGISADRLSVETGNEGFTENPVITTDASEMPSIVEEQSAGIEGGFAGNVVPTTNIPDSEGVYQGIDTLPGTHVPAEVGHEDNFEQTSRVLGGSDMHSMISNHSTAMEAGASEDFVVSCGEGIIPTPITEVPASQMPEFTPGTIPDADMYGIHEATSQTISGMPEFNAEFASAPVSAPAVAVVGDIDEDPHFAVMGDLEADASAGTEASRFGDNFVPSEGIQPTIAFPAGSVDMPTDSMAIPGSYDSAVEAPQFGEAFVPNAEQVQPHVEHLSGGMENVSGGTYIEVGTHEVPSIDYSTASAHVSGGGENASVPVSEDNAHQFGADFAGGVQIPTSEDSHIPGGDESLYYNDLHTSGGDHGDSGGYHGSYAEAPLVAATFPNAQEGTMLRTVEDGVIEASSPEGGNTLWYNSAYYQEPDAPHSVMEAANGVQWYAMQQQAQTPQFEAGAEAVQYNQAAFQNFMPGYDAQVAHVDGTHRLDGHFEVRNADGSGTAFFDTARFAAPRGDYQVLEDIRGSQWYAIRGEAAVDRKPVFENGRAVYDDGKLRTVSVETVRYKQTPARYTEPKKRGDIDRKPPRRKQ